jgi:hypothetical protein
MYICVFMTFSTSCCLCDKLKDLWNVCMYCLLIVNHDLSMRAAVSLVNYSVGRGMELQRGKCFRVQHWSENTDVIRFNLLN